MTTSRNPFRFLRRPARRRPIRKAVRPALEALECRLAPSVDVVNWRGNVPGNNSGANLNETQLIPTKVNLNNFGLQFTYPVDGQVYAEPLVKTGVSIAGKGTHDVVFVATQHDSVYAFDADSNAGANSDPLWKVSFINPQLGVTTVPNGVTGSDDITPEIGITATPYIDAGTNTLYVVSKTQEMVGGVAHYVQRLHALDITSHAEKFGGPVLIGDTTANGGPDGGYTDNTPVFLPGTGDGSDGTTVRFNALRENERDGLFISKGVLYLSYTSHGDVGPYHGWLLGYDPTTLKLVSFYNTTPNGGLGAIWMGGGQPAVDGNGFIYFTTGNGTFDAAGGGPAALGPAGGGLGYGPDHTGGMGGIGNSVAVKFDLFQNVSEGNDSTGIFSGGRSPTVRDPSLPATPTPTLPDQSVDMTGSAIDLHSQHVMQATLSYDGTTLSETIKDTATGGTFTTSYAVNIPSIVGGNTAYVGFTGGTGGLTAAQDVQTWKFSNGATTTIDHSAGFASHGDLTNNGNAFYSGTAARLTDGGTGEAGSVFSNAKVNITNFSTTFTFLQAAGTSPTADGMTFTIENAGPGPDYAMSMEKVSPTPGANGQLPVVSFFTPHDQANLSGVDLDQGSGGNLLLPDSAGSTAHPHLLVQTGKTGRIYLLDRDKLGGFTPTDGGAVQVLPDGTVSGGSYDNPAYFNNGTQQLIYYMGAGDVLKSFTVSGGQLSTQPFAATTQIFGFPGANPVVSANGTGSGIVWAVDTTNNGTGGHPASAPAVLHAYDATTLKELYNSSQLGTLDQLANAVKFVVPTVANGKVYVGTQNSVSVFGLFNATAAPAAPSNLTATATGPTSVALKWTDNATNARLLKVLRGIDKKGPFTQIATLAPNLSSFNDTTAQPDTTYYYRVVATNGVGDSGPSNTASVTTLIAPSVLRITGTGSSQVNLAWTDTASSYAVLRSTDGINFTDIGKPKHKTPTTFVDTGLAPGIYYYEVEGFGSNNQTAFSNVVRDTVGEPTVIDHSGGFSSNGDLVANGSASFYPVSSPVGIFAGHQDIGTQGDPGTAGSATFDSGTGAYTLTASGSDVWSNNDHMQYVYEPLVGDGSVVARLVSATAPDFWTKAGVMVRDGLTTGAANDFMLDTPQPGHNEPIMQFRDSDNGQTSDSGNHFTPTTPNVPTPVWLKLVRSGNTFTGYWASDSNGAPGTWNLMSQGDPHTTVMPTTVYVGLGLTAHNNGAVASATFDHVTVTGKTAALPPAVAGLTDGGFGEAGSVFTSQKEDVRSFTTTFTFQISGGTTPFGADGLAFVIQNNSAQALGGAGGGLGYQGVGNSVAVGFRAFAGPGVVINGNFYPSSTTELGEGGNFVTTNSLDGSGINFNAGSQDNPPDVYSVTLSYSGTTLTETLKDTTTGKTYTASYANVNIPALVGGDTAYVGFSGGTGGLSLVGAVQTWKFTPTTQNLAPLGPSNLQVATVNQHDANRNDVTVNWTTNSYNETGYEVWRSTDGTTFTKLATLPANSMSFTDSKLDAGTYFYKVRAFNANGASLFSNTDSVITGAPGSTVTVDHSGGFSSNGDLTANGSATFYPNSTPVGTFAGHMDIGTQGDPGTPGSATFNSGTGAYTLTASGSDIWGNSDNMQYVYKPLVGDGSVVARLVSATAPDFWTKAGVMVRDDLTAGAANDFMLFTPQPGHGEPIMQFRDSDGGGTGDSGNHFNFSNPPTTPYGISTPVWLRLDRVGNVFTGYWATDNNGTPGTWNLMSQGDPHTTVMPTTVYVGLGLTAHNNGTVASATFDHVTVTGTTAALPPAVARLTDGGGNEAGSVFTNSRVEVDNFDTNFTFRMHDGTNPSADGMAFVLQANSPSALGSTGGGLGYGSDHPGGPQGIPNSIAVKFDLYSNAGEGTDSTGIFFNGDSPTVPTTAGLAAGEATVDMTGSGIDLHSQDVFQVELSYDGTTLNETIQDTNTGASFSTSYTVDIPTLIGTNLAYAGFSGGTGGLTTVADVQTWTYTFTQGGAGNGATGLVTTSDATGGTGGALVLAGSGSGTAGTGSTAGTAASSTPLPTGPDTGSGTGSLTSSGGTTATGSGSSLYGANLFFGTLGQSGPISTDGPTVPDSTDPSVADQVFSLPEQLPPTP